MAVPDAIDEADIEVVLRIIRTAIRPISEKRVPTLLFAATFIALAKKGDISQRKMEAIISELETDLGYCVEMTPAMIKGVWTYVGAYLDVTQFPYMFRTWEHEMSTISLRMRITLQQAAWTGLTQYSTILKMFREYPGFPWAQVAALLPADWENFRQAVEAVGGDAYYGFRANIGPATATNFLSLGYLAKEMIKKIGG